MSSTQHTPANPETHTCGMCGYTWRHGLHGGHDCATRLKAQRDELVGALKALRDEAVDVWDYPQDYAQIENADEVLAKHAGSAS